MLILQMILWLDTYRSVYVKETLPAAAWHSWKGGGYGNRLVAFVSPGCRYCRIARQKLTPIAGCGCLPDGAIVYVEPDAAAGGVSKRADGTWQVPVGLFMVLTRGNRHYIVLLEDGQPTLTFHYRNISERRIVRSLKSNIQ